MLIDITSWISISTPKVFIPTSFQKPHETVLPNYLRMSFYFDHEYSCCKIFFEIFKESDCCSTILRETYDISLISYLFLGENEALVTLDTHPASN